MALHGLRIKKDQRVNDVIKKKMALEDIFFDVEMRSLNYWNTGSMPKKGKVNPELNYKKHLRVQEDPL